MKICAIIPFYNESTTIKKVLEETLGYVDVVIAVNDGSTDNSVSKIFINENIIVLNEGENRGKGFALRKGFTKAVELGCDAVITLDADMQHNPDSIPALLSGLDNFDLVVGNRIKDLSGMPFQRIMSNKLTSFLLSKKTGMKIMDSQCGFRAFSREVLMKAQSRSNGYEAESEIIILAARAGFKIGFVEVETIYGNEKSKMNPVKAIFGFIKVLFY
ncbi:MAG: glycosyltransferase family 2 protein [Ignavibacteria bacterium]|nr:glycosyltransferase family 2 protein [Ignavibacteria bacterium]